MLAANVRANAPAALRGVPTCPPTTRDKPTHAPPTPPRARRPAAMSYRELRNFKEIMATLGYPRLISIENFKVPHFELVADILIWLCHRYDKNMEILDDIRTEQDRVAFLKSVAEQLLVKARVKLNLKNLYASNGFAVRELLKVATLLHDAYKNASAEEGEGQEEAMSVDIGPGHKFADMKLTRSLSQDITKYGARLYELLGNHADAKEAAAKALGKNYDIEDMQKQLHRMVESVGEQTEQMDRMLGNVGQDEQNLQTKIDKKKTELDRHQKRLQSLQTVRPAFMDEYERLEQELNGQYSQYLQSWRNMSFLEAELDAINAQEQEKIQENDRQLQLMQRRLREEELKILRGQAKVDEQAIDDALGQEQRRPGGGMKRPGAASSRRDGGGRGGDGGGGGGGGDFGQDAGIYGSMKPLEEDDEESEEEEEEEEEEEDDDDDEEDEDEDDDEDAQVRAPTRLVSRRPPHAHHPARHPAASVAAPRRIQVGCAAADSRGPSLIDRLELHTRPSRRAAPAPACVRLWAVAHSPRPTPLPFAAPAPLDLSPSVRTGARMAAAAVRRAILAGTAGTVGIWTTTTTTTTSTTMTRRARRRRAAARRTTTSDCRSRSSSRVRGPLGMLCLACTCSCSGACSVVYIPSAFSIKRTIHEPQQALLAAVERGEAADALNAALRPPGRAPDDACAQKARFVCLHLQAELLVRMLQAGGEDLLVVVRVAALEHPLEAAREVLSVPARAQPPEVDAGEAWAERVGREDGERAVGADRMVDGTPSIVEAMCAATEVVDQIGTHEHDHLVSAIPLVLALGSQPPKALQREEVAEHRSGAVVASFATREQLLLQLVNFAAGGEFHRRWAQDLERLSCTVRLHRSCRLPVAALRGSPALGHFPLEGLQEQQKLVAAWSKLVEHVALQREPQPRRLQEATLDPTHQDGNVRFVGHWAQRWLRQASARLQLGVCSSGPWRLRPIVARADGVLYNGGWLLAREQVDVTRRAKQPQRALVALRVRVGHPDGPAAVQAAVHPR